MINNRDSKGRNTIMKHILLAVTGGIAAYKAIDLTSKPVTMYV